MKTLLWSSLILCALAGYASSFMFLDHYIRLVKLVCTGGSHFAELSDKTSRQCNSYIPDFAKIIELKLRLKCNVPFATNTELRVAFCEDPMSFKPSLKCVFDVARTCNKPLPIPTEHDWQQAFKHISCNLDFVQVFTDIHNHIFAGHDWLH